MKQEPEKLKSTDAAEPGQKRPYSSPSILFRERMESVADVCSSDDAKSGPDSIAIDGMGVCGYLGGVYGS